MPAEVQKKKRPAAPRRRQSQICEQFVQKNSRSSLCSCTATPLLLTCSRGSVHVHAVFFFASPIFYFFWSRLVPQFRLVARAGERRLSRRGAQVGRWLEAPLATAFSMPSFDPELDLALFFSEPGLPRLFCSVSRLFRLPGRKRCFREMPMTQLLPEGQSP